MGEKNKDLDNLYLQCQGCANKYTSFECALCEDFDMYKEEYKEDKEVNDGTLAQTMDSPNKVDDPWNHPDNPEVWKNKHKMILEYEG